MYKPHSLESSLHTVLRNPGHGKSMLASLKVRNAYFLMEKWENGATLYAFNKLHTVFPYTIHWGK